MKLSALLRFYYDNRKYLPGLILIVGLSLASGVLKMLAATCWGRAVDLGVAGQVNDMLVNAGLMGLFILLDCARTAVHYRIIGHITESMFLEVRARAFEKITRGDGGVLENHFRTGDVAARLNSDIDFLSTFSSGHLSNFSRMIFSGMFGLAACICISWQLALIYMIILPISIWTVAAISGPIQAQSKRSMDSTGSAMSTAADAISGALTVKAFAAQDALEARFSRSVDAAYREKVRTEKLSMKMTGVKYIAKVMQLMSLFLMGGWLVQGGMLTVGAFVAFVTLSNYITEAFDNSDYMLKSLRSAAANAQRYYEVIDIPDEWGGPARQRQNDVPCQAEALRFTYDGASIPALDGLNLAVPPGQKVAVVGASGCGKSTLVKLICRLYLPGKGSLKLFGTDVSAWDPDALRQNIAIVTQESNLFDGSIYENIAYGRPGLSRQDCEQALRAVSLWDFVCSFPEGMDHIIGESGQTLSGGQKQRLCIARAMVKQAPLVLLDEATSALDLQTEREVQESLDKLLAGRAAIIIAHRLSTVQGADYIYVMESGKAVEEGPPQELLARKGKYWEMCRLQGLTEVAQ